MAIKTFKALDELEIIVKSSRAALSFEINQEQAKINYHFLFKFHPEIFKQFVDDIETMAKESWPALQPSEANSEGSDYYEYYDSLLDSNGYLSVKDCALLIERPSLDSTILYRFNKKKMQSFLYDLKNIYNLRT